MLPSTICLRCRSRLLQASLQSSGRQARDFISLRHDSKSSKTDQNQVDSISPKQAQHQQNNKAQWTSPRKNMEDSMESLLDGVFDSNRHETPRSPVYRYSRRPIKQQDPQQVQALDAAIGNANVRIPSGEKTFSRDSMLAGHNARKIRSEKPTYIPSESSTNTMTGSNLGIKSTQETQDIHESETRADASMAIAPDEAIAGIESDFGEVRIRRTFKPPVTQAQNSSLSFDQFRTRILTGDIRSTNQLWAQFQKSSRQAEFKQAELEMLCADFLWAFGKVRKTEPLMEVWSYMGEQGIDATIRHWNAILKVLQRNRDLQRFQAIWQAMLDGGTRPNHESWTIQIELLLSQPRHDWRAAMRLLDTMGNTWREAQAEGINEPEYLPSIEPINAAITGLLRMHLINAASDVFTWARSFPVQIDATCYNIFVRYICQNGDNTSIFSILKQMESYGVKQDVVTKTIMLDSALRNPGSSFHALSPPEQERFVIERLNQMTNEGTPPNAQTFAVALHALLHLSTPNLPAAQAVFQISRQAGHKVSPQIYTIFLTHHFNSGNPDLNAVESVWEEIEAQRTKIDHVLYDRMIEGYAAIGELEKMLALFKKMTATGQTPGWLALEKALTALVTAGAWKLCAQFVADVTNEDGHLHVGKRGWKGEREFWQLVSDLQQQGLIPPKKAVQT